MYIFSNKTLPIDRWLQGKFEHISVIVQRVRENPGHFLSEFFTLCMMILGVVTLSQYAYELGLLVGRSF